MRMWMINPKLLCRNHLLGEHNELHRFRPSFVKQHRITKRISPVVQIEPNSMKVRHDELVVEMLRRGYNHKSPYELPDLSYLGGRERYAKVDLNISHEDLKHRCPKCAKNMII